MDESIHHVSDTALWVAIFRDRETHRPDALFKDPWAHLLAGERGERIAEQTSLRRYVEWTVIIRTCVIDGYLNELIKNKGVDTIVNLGAGLDTRPYRMSLPSSLRWIEVDFPAIIDLKNELLKGEQPKCRLERVAADLSDDAVRRKVLSEISAGSGKVAVLTEGVVPYLTPEQAGALADDLRGQGNFSFWIVDQFSQEVARRLQTGKLGQQLRSTPIRFAPKDWTAFFGAHRWHVHETRHLIVEGEKLGRPIPVPWFIQLLRPLMSRKTRERLRTMGGYSLLVPATQGTASPR